MRWYETFEEARKQVRLARGEAGETAMAWVLQCPIHYIGILEFCLKSNVTHWV